MSVAKGQHFFSLYVVSYYACSRCGPIFLVEKRTHAYGSARGGIPSFSLPTRVARPSTPVSVTAQQNVFFSYLPVFFKGIYECPGGTILRTAHLDIETFTMDRVS